VHVSASNNGVSFTDAHDVKITVTNFGVGASPASNTVTAGNAASYSVTVTAQGGPFSGPVTLGCANLPAQATCTFNPAVVTPGASSATAVLTIGTGTKSSLLPTTLMRGHGVPASRTAVRAGKASALLAVGTDAGGPGARGAEVSPSPAVFVMLLALGAALLTFARRSRPIAVAGLGTAVALLVMLQACGGSSSSNSGSNGGGGSGASVTISPASLSFSSQGLGSTSPAQTVTLSNGTTSAIGIASVATNGDFAETTTCGASLASAANCTIAVTFTPTAGGSRAGSLVVTDSGAGSPRTVALTGTGLAGPTAAGTYSINVTGTAGTLVQAGTVGLTVQ
jgi:hypothetical protein